MNESSQISLSIVIPTIGRKSLDETLESVILQTVSPREIIVFDNSGKNEVRAKSRWNSHPFIHWYHSDIKKDIISSWNTAVSYATSSYIYVLGDDDILLQDFVENINVFLTQGYDAVYAMPLLMNKKGECTVPSLELPAKLENSSETFLNSFLRGTDYPIFLGTLIFSRKAFDKIKGYKSIVANALYMDHLFHLEIILSSKRLALTDKVRWKYRCEVDDWSGRIQDAKTIIRFGSQFRHFLLYLNEILKPLNYSLEESFYRKNFILMIYTIFPLNFSILKYLSVLWVCLYPYRSFRDNIFLLRSFVYVIRHRLMKKQ